MIAKQTTPIVGVMKISSGTHGDEGDGDTRKRAEKGCARRDLANVGGDETADHQDEALEQNPHETCFPALHGIAVWSAIGA